MMQRKDEAREIWKQGLDHEPENEVLLKTLKRFGVKLEKAR